MKNPYILLIEDGKIGILSKIINLEKFEVSNAPEKIMLESFFIFLGENLDGKDIEARDFIKRLCLLDKALGSEINGRFLMKNGKRFQSFGRPDHYEMKLMHALKDLNLEYDPEMMLTKDLIERLADAISKWTGGGR